MNPPGRMRRLALVSLALASLLAAAGVARAAEPARAKEGTWHGVITDDRCGRKHMGADEKACAQSCVENGAKYALYDPKADKVFILSDQARARALVTEHVVVKRTLSPDGGTIQVTDIQKGEGRKEGRK